MIVDRKSQGTPLPHTWSRCIGAGRAKEGLRARWQEHLRRAVRECGFEYIRFHGLLAEDMFPATECGGELFFNWTLIDQLFDALQDIGIRPVVELGFMPPALASGSSTQFWWRGNVTPPGDCALWGRLVRELTAHFAERYGIDEVRRWYFEVWNEPNLHAFWDGTRSQYFELYRVFTDIFEEVGAGPEAFHGGFGLMTAHGIRKPAYHAYRFLNRLGYETLVREDEAAVTGPAEGKIAALLWNYAKELRQAVPMSEYPDWREAERIEKLGETRTRRLTLTGLVSGAVFEIETLDAEHSAAALWRRMGRPRSLTRAQEAALKALEPPKAAASADSKGVLDLTLTLSPWAVVSVREI